jgi:hypothetical protein
MKRSLGAAAARIRNLTWGCIIVNLIKQMRERTGSMKDPVISEVRKKIRVLILVITFVIAVLFSIILGLLYEPVSFLFDYIPELSITVIIASHIPSVTARAVSFVDPVTADPQNN